MTSTLITKLCYKELGDIHSLSAGNALPVCLNNTALSLSNCSHQLKHFYFSSYWHTERYRAFTVNVLYKFPAYYNDDRWVTLLLVLVGGMIGPLCAD